MSMTNGNSLSVVADKYAKIFQLSSNLLSLSTFSDGRFLEVNDAFLQTLGFSREEVIGKTAAQLGLYVNPPDREKLVQATALSAPVRNIALLIRDKSGAIHDALFSADVIEIGAEKCWLVSISDISQLKRDMAVVQEYTALYQQVVDSQSELVCRYGVDGKLFFVNDSYARYFGKRKSELIGFNFIPHIPEPDLTLIARHLAGISRERPCVLFEHRVIMPDGTVRWQQWSHKGIYAIDGRLVEYQAVGRDVTDFKIVTQQMLEQAEEKFRYIFENAADGMALIDPVSRNLVLCNQALCRMLGYSPEQIYGLKIDAVIPPQDFATIAQQFKNQFQGKSRLTMDVPLRRKNGEEFYAGVSLSEFRVNSDKYLAVVFRDITEYRAALQQLARVQNQLQGVINAASQVAIIATDFYGTITIFNSGAERILGYSAQEFVGKQTPLAFHLESEIKLRAQELTVELGHPVEGFEVFVARAKIGKYDENEWTFVRKDGSHVTVNLIVTAVKNESGTIIGFLGIAVDVTARRRLLQAQVASAAKSRFIANISHEIRTPLSGIIGVSDLLLATKLPKVQLEYARIISSSAEALANVINATLDFAQIEAGKVVLQQVDFNLRNVVEDVASVLAVNAFKKKLELICFIAPDVPERLNGDPGHVRQVLFNIIGNAIKFTDSGEIVVNVAREADKKNKVVLRFSVRDTGIGIPGDKIGVIFHNFTQGDDSVSRRFGGTGLGLTITKALVAKMGGTIGVKSNPGKGSVFWFVLSFVRQKPAAPAVRPRFNLARTRILIVDDNASNRIMLARQLRAWKINVATAAGGDQALVQLRSAARKKQFFTAAILDMHMPGMNGLTLGQAIKTDAVLKKTILFLMTAVVMPPEFLKRNMDFFAGVIFKPVRQGELWQSLLLCQQNKKNKKRASFNEQPRLRTGKQLHVLVAEDNLANQLVVASLLKRIGHVVKVVASGQAAVKALERKAYDLVLMDIQMPGIDGLRATAMIRDPRSAVRDHAVPILAITAHVLQGEREKCLASGMNDYIVKPISLPALVAAIARVTSPRNTPAPRDRQVVDDDRVVFDSRAVFGRLGGKVGCLREVIKITLVEMPQLIRKLAWAVKKRQMSAAARLAHTLRGAAINVSGNQFAAFTIKLEAACNAGAWHEVERVLPELNRQFAMLAQALRGYLQKLRLPAARQATMPPSGS